MSAEGWFLIVFAYLSEREWLQKSLFASHIFALFTYGLLVYMTAGFNAFVFMCNRVLFIDWGHFSLCFLQYARAKTADTKQNLFAVLLDFVIHDLMQAALISEKQPPSMEEIQAVVSALCLADAPESFALAFKQGLQGVGESIAKSIVTAMARDVTNGRLNAQVHMTEVIQMFRPSVQHCVMALSYFAVSY